ncbi:hypothetical protein QBC34DRAFT_163842 [Podospora aff. communis PSN243]|uniref:Transposase Tc1-like domain-containing protein n=1 Tax=Podospora aff. communis PSN243 TaxID=3040156 RepID=A0AAV9GC13_9PEZI|nr:hypothetical protein QBC34DRAFT_163842 [Podospora aff. communis PSN243]
MNSFLFARGTCYSLAGTSSKMTGLDFPIRKSQRPNVGLQATQNWDAMCHHLSAADNGIINRTTTTMAPSLALHKRVLIQSIINSKLQGDDDLKDDEIADVAGCSARAVRRIRSNLLRL